MVFTVSKVLLLISVIIFAVTFGVIVWGSPPAKFFAEGILMGLVFFASSFLVP